MKIPETYEEFLKTPKEELKKLAWQKMSKEKASLIMTFVLKYIDDFADDYADYIIFAQKLPEDFIRRYIDYICKKNNLDPCFLNYSLIEDKDMV